MLIFRGVSENSASRFTANSRDFPVCFLEPDNLKLVKSSHCKCLFNLETNTTFIFFVLKVATFHKIFSSPKSFRFQHYSKHFFPSKTDFLRRGATFVQQAACLPGPVTTWLWQKRGAFRASRRFHSGFFAAKSGGIFATRFQNMWKSWKKWTKAISLHSLFGWIERQTIWASNNKVSHTVS